LRNLCTMFTHFKEAMKGGREERKGRTGSVVFP
jgi:hypothetical protein